MTSEQTENCQLTPTIIPFVKIKNEENQHDTKDNVLSEIFKPELDLVKIKLEESGAELENHQVLKLTKAKNASKNDFDLPDKGNFFMERNEYDYPNSHQNT